jgi:hypothetical protein
MASIIKVDTIQDQNGNNIINEAANTITIGASGDTITIPSGATLANSGIVTGFQSTGIDDNATSTAITIDSSENVGIGTASPERDLHVNAGSLDIVGLFESTDATADIAFYDSTGGVKLGSSGNNFVFKTGSGSTGLGGTERMRIDSSGNVGIGTSSPSRKLHVLSGTGTAQIQSTTTASTLYFGDTNSTAIDNQGIGSLGTNIFLMTNGSERMRIDSSGNVGIGTTSPVTLKSATTLQVNGNAKLGDNNARGLLSLGDITSGDANVGIWRGSAGAYAGTGNYLNLGGYDGIAFTTGNALIASQTERMRIDSSGNVGIGTSSPDSVVNIEATKTTALSTANDFLTLGLTVDDTTAYNTSGGVGGGITFRGKRNSSGVQTVYGAIVGTKNGTTNDEYNGNLRFFTNNNTNGIPTEHMRINRSGYVGIGTTSPAHAIELWGDGGNTIFAIRDTDGSPTFSNRYIKFQDANGTEIGKILRQGSSIAYSTSSDHRLKENVNYTFDATTRLKQLRPARFNFIGYDNVVDGFIAHEVSSVVPEAISGTHNGVEVWKEGEELPEGVSVGDNKLDENGNTIPEYQGIDQSKLVPLLVKTIQELEDRITALETNQP